MIVFVFDPLAVLMVMAASKEFTRRKEINHEEHRRENSEKTEKNAEEFRDWKHDEGIQAEIKDDPVMVDAEGTPAKK